MAFILFYYMGNPSLVVFDQAMASWWLIFIARHCLMLELATAIDYVIIIDVWALRTRLVVNLFGPWLTLLLVANANYCGLSLGHLCHDSAQRRQKLSAKLTLLFRYCHF
jgi:hypothetical protein